MSDITYAQVWADHVIRVGEPGETVVVTVLSGDTLYYGDPTVSASNNFGSLTVGQSVSLTAATTWLRSASNSFVRIAGSKTAGTVSDSVSVAPSIQGASGSNLSAAQTVDFGGLASEIWVVGTLNANLTVTVANRTSGSRAFLLLTQDGTGGRTLTVTDGANPQAVPITSTAGSFSVIEVKCPDATAVDVSVGTAANITSGDVSVSSGVSTVSSVLGGQSPATAGNRFKGSALRPLARDILLLDNSTGFGYTSQVIFPEQFIPDGTGNMYMLYQGTGGSGNSACLARASGTLANPASPDPRVNAFTDLGPCKLTNSNPITGDAPHLVIANGYYFLFSAQNTAAGAQIYLYTAPQVSGGAIIPLSTAMTNFSTPASIAAYPAASNPTGVTLTQGGAGSLPNSLQTIGVTALDHDGIESGLVTNTFTPTASSAINASWTASATGETNGYNVYRNGQKIASVAHGTTTYVVTGAESLGAAPPSYTAASCTRLDEPFVFYDNVAGQWRMLCMGFNTAGTMEQIHLFNLSSSGYAALTNSTFSFVKQNNSQPVLPAGNYASVFGTSIPGGSGMATLYDYECTADPWVVQFGNTFVIGYAAGGQGSIATTSIYRTALAFTKDFSTFTKLGIGQHASAIKNPADASNGAALDTNGFNRSCNGSWRGSLYVDANGIGHMVRTGSHGNSGGTNGNQAYYFQYDLSGVLDAVQGTRAADPWVRVEAESTDARLTFSGFASVSGLFPYFSGGALGGSGGKARFSATAGDSITFTFLGTAVRVAVSRVTSARKCTIALDGGGTEGVNQFTDIDMTLLASGNHDPLFAAQFDNLTPGVHQLKVTVSGTGANNLFVDCFDYIPMQGLPA